MNSHWITPTSSLSSDSIPEQLRRITESMVRDLASQPQETQKTEVHGFIRAYVISEGRATAAVFQNLLKRIQFTRNVTDQNEREYRLEARLAFGLEQIGVIETLADVLMETCQSSPLFLPGPDQIKTLVVEISTFLLFQDPILMKNNLEQSLESMVLPSTLRAAKEPCELIRKAVNKYKSLHISSFLNGTQQASPIHHLKRFQSQVTHYCGVFVKHRNDTGTNPSLRMKLPSTYFEDTMRIQQYWASALSDIEKVVLYLMELVLSCTY